MDNLTTSVPVAVNLIPATSTTKQSASATAISNQQSGLLANSPSNQSSVIQQGQQHPVIQTAHGNQLQQQLQNMHDNSDQNCVTADGVLDEEAKKRRDILSRRPSYRKILNDLSSDNPVKVETFDENSSESNESAENAEGSEVNEMTGQHAAVAVQVSSNDGMHMQGIQAIQIPASNGQAQQATVVQFNGQAYTIRGQLPAGMVCSPNSAQTSPQHTSLAEEAARKRELRLLKNREAAKECRRKKKEYVKCLENRVAVLENQNKALIDELKALKDLYCNKTD